MSSLNCSIHFLLTLSHLLALIACSRFLGYGDDCSNVKHCDISKFQICVNGKCQCENPSTMFYSEKDDICVTKLNESCNLEEVWSRGSSQANQMIGITGEFGLSSIKLTRRAICVENAVCDETSQKCVCKADVDENGQCIFSKESPPFMDSCDYDGKPCPENTGLKCVNGRCHCGSEFHKYFNGSKCLSLAYGPCEKKADCTPWSDCMKWIGLPGRCECSLGFIRNKMRYCEGGQGQACNDNDMPCSEEAGLKCVNGKCQCPDELQFFSQHYGRCLSLVGGKCFLNRGRYQDNCISEAYCEDLFRDGSFGVCKCKDGYVDKEDRTCRKG